MRSLFAALFAALLAAPAVVRSAEPPPPLRWPEVAAAVAQQPQFREAEARASGATGAIWTAESIPNPQVTFTGARASARDGSASRNEWGLAAALPLDFLASYRQRVAAARAAAQGFEQDALGARAQALRTLRRDFVALARAQALVEAQLELEAQLSSLAALVRRRVEQGEARPTEVPRVELELERLRSAVDRARAGAEAQRLRLSTSLGRPVARVEADLAQAIPIPSLDGVRARVAGEAPALRAGRARVAASAQELSAERWDRLPKVAVGAGHVEELDRSATSVSVTLTLPLWNWSAGRVRQAEAAVEVEQARLEASARELEAGVTDAWQACTAGQSATRRFREEILPRAQEAARTMGRAFELGEAGLLDVIDTRRVLLDTRRESLDLFLDMQNACGDLAALAGLELP
jgi:cobalt-zinc-cadmium efflux system outer membrane protein